MNAQPVNRWDTPGIPHKGWELLYSYDMGYGDNKTCEMCGNEHIRFVFVMLHPEVENELEVGCVCASKMTDDYETPQRQQNAMKQKMEARDRWVFRKWRTSRKGNLFLNANKVNVTVFPYGRRWKYVVNGKVSSRQYDSQIEAQYGAFDAYHELTH